MSPIDRNEFQKVLFRTAFCVMACDGEIHPKEIEEIKQMNKSASYFQGIDLSDELENLLLDLKEKGKHFIDELVISLSTLELSIIQELLVLEVAFRMIYADSKVDENEIKFIRFLRSKLNLQDEIIRDRFGVVEFLFDKDYSKDIVKKDAEIDFLSTTAIPEYKELVLVDFSKFNDK
jgi:uncharacterized tellurite resistance protein B-like protein